VGTEAVIGGGADLCGEEWCYVVRFRGPFANVPKNVPSLSQVIFGSRDGTIAPGCGEKPNPQF
jgi:hypothetical protein